MNSILLMKCILNCILTFHTNIKKCKKYLNIECIKCNHINTKKLKWNHKHNYSIGF